MIVERGFEFVWLCKDLTTLWTGDNYFKKLFKLMFTENKKKHSSNNRQGLEGTIWGLYRIFSSYFILVCELCCFYDFQFVYSRFRSWIMQTLLTNFSKCFLWHLKCYFCSIFVSRNFFKATIRVGNEVVFVSKLSSAENSSRSSKSQYFPKQKFW